MRSRDRDLEWADRRARISPKSGSNSGPFAAHTGFFEPADLEVSVKDNEVIGLAEGSAALAVHSSERWQSQEVREGPGRSRAVSSDLIGCLRPMLTDASGNEVMPKFRKKFAVSLRNFRAIRRLGSFSLALARACGHLSERNQPISLA